MDKHKTLVSRLQYEADLCRNEGATDIAALLDEAVEALESVVAAERERCVKACRSAVYGRVGGATMRQVADWCAEEIARGRSPLPGA